MSCYVLCDKDIILDKDGNLPEFSDLQHIKDSNTVAEYFEEKQFDLKVLGLRTKDNLPQGFNAIPLRLYFNTHTEDENFHAFRAQSLFNWRQSEQYCSCCGAKLEEHKTLTARVCPECRREFFPKIAPCVIVLVNKDNKILLARHTYRNQDIYACIAGFIEAGESAEHAVERELFEETGLKVKNITYRGSQSWPFPNQLMLGFTADYASGELKLQKEEIADAKWFDPDNCPASPKPGSIAYRLIHKLY